MRGDRRQHFIEETTICAYGKTGTQIKLQGWYTVRRHVQTKTWMAWTREINEKCLLFHFEVPFRLLKKKDQRVVSDIDI